MIIGQSDDFTNITEGALSDRFVEAMMAIGFSDEGDYLVYSAPVSELHIFEGVVYLCCSE